MVIIRENTKTIVYRNHGHWTLGQCWQASSNSPIKLLNETDWDDGAPTLASSTQAPVCSRRLAILWSLVERNKVWGEERCRMAQSRLPMFACKLLCLCYFFNFLRHSGAFHDPIK